MQPANRTARARGYGARGSPGGGRCTSRWTRRWSGSQPAGGSGRRRREYTPGPTWRHSSARLKTHTIAQTTAGERVTLPFNAITHIFAIVAERGVSIASFSAPTLTMQILQIAVFAWWQWQSRAASHVVNHVLVYSYWLRPGPSSPHSRTMRRSSSSPIGAKPKACISSPNVPSR